VGEVLVVDDDQTLASVVVDYLRRAGHAVGRADDGFQALQAVTERDVDLVILDVMLPGVDGLEVCRRMRRTTPALPVVMLTALGEVDDRIAGLEVGADDYVTKPFSPRELVLRVESVLRRTSRSRTEPLGVAKRLTAGPVRIDARSRRAYKNDAELSLTVREFDLLAFLLAHPGHAYSREQLMREVWGWTFGDQSTVTVHVRRLREKIEDDPTRPTLIQTVWGIGYRLDPP
jgi:two-component system, OmpR family, response regulator ResD